METIAKSKNRPMILIGGLVIFNIANRLHSK